MSCLLSVGHIEILAYKNCLEEQKLKKSRLLLNVGGRLMCWCSCLLRQQLLGVQFLMHFQL